MKNTRRRLGSILVVEDDPGVRGMLSIVLSMWGYNVITASDGGAAMEAYRPGQFSLVLTDYNMPGMCGDELARRIREICPTQPMLMLTAYVQEARGDRNPVDQILVKPPSLGELRTAVQCLAAVPPEVSAAPT